MMKSSQGRGGAGRRGWTLVISIKNVWPGDKLGLGIEDIGCLDNPQSTSAG